MKKLVFALIFTTGISIFNIYGQTKNDDIVKLLRVSGSDKLADQMLAAMMPQLKQLAPNLPNSFWTRFIEKINTDDLLYACIAAYSKHYTHDEIKQLIAFYESPLGKKVVAVTPLLTQETMAIGQKWGEKIAEDIVNEILLEGY
jgi:hypothetical protein